MTSKFDRIYGRESVFHRLLLFASFVECCTRQVDDKMSVYDKAFEQHPVAVGKAISKKER